MKNIQPIYKIRDKAISESESMSIHNLLTMAEVGKQFNEMLEQFETDLSQLAEIGKMRKKPPMAKMARGARKKTSKFLEALDHRIEGLGK